MLFKYSISGKWLELLKQIAPDVKRVAVLGDPDTLTGLAQFGVIQAVAPLLRAEVQQARPPRDRAHHRGLRASSKWRTD